LDWVFAKTGYPQIKEKLKKLFNNNAVATAGPIVLELLQDCRSAKERGILQEQLEGIYWLVTEDQHWFQAGKMANDLQQKGNTVSAIGALIAALAQAYQCQLMHLDQDYEHIAQHTTLFLFPMEGP
jgi:predicted nucleic acid-binding protein